MTEAERDTICAALDRVIVQQQETSLLLDCLVQRLDETKQQLAALVLERQVAEGPGN